MEKFKKTLETRVSLLMGYIGLIILLIATLSIFTPHEDDYKIGFVLGLAVASELLAIAYMSKCRKALKDENTLKQLYIKEHDERYIYIKSKIGGLGLNIVIGGLALAMLIALFFNNIVFFSLYCALLFSALVKAGLKLYYRNKV